MSEDEGAVQTEQSITSDNDDDDERNGAVLSPSLDGTKLEVHDDELELTRSTLVKVLNTPDKGRGIFARQNIPPDTLIEVSPVLIVKAHEYTNNNLVQSIFESYLFTWSRNTTSGGSDYALALGLGSLFNHSSTAPNVSYTLDKQNQCIRYRTSKAIKEDEELCIFYGHGVKFGDQGQLLIDKSSESDVEGEDDILKAFGGLHQDDTDNNSINSDSQSTSSSISIDEADLNEPVPEEDLPFSIITGYIAPEDVPLELINVYTVTFDPRQSPHFFKFLQAQGFQQLESVRYLRKVRKTPEGLAEAIICPVADIALEDLVQALETVPELNASAMSPSIVPSIRSVPANPARTIPQGQEWSQSYWPVTVIPVKADLAAKNRAQTFTEAKVRWYKEMCQKVIKAANEAWVSDELPIACIAAESWDGSIHSMKIRHKKPIVLATHCDSRESSGNPFGHAVMNLLAHVAELDKDGLRPSMPSDDAHYLLTGLTVFMTHEPCLLCSMALLHSRIATLVYIRASPGAGGCGSEYSLHEQKGTNHKYEVWKIEPEGDWADAVKEVAELEVDP